MRAYRTGPVVELRAWVKRNRSFAATIAAASLLVIASSIGFGVVEANYSNLADQRALDQLSASIVTTFAWGASGAIVTLLGPAVGLLIDAATFLASLLTVVWARWSADPARVSYALCRWGRLSLRRWRRRGWRPRPASRTRAT